MRTGNSGQVEAVLAEPRPDVLDDRYEVGTLIGRGGMGDVHRATDRRLGREVAVKFLRTELAVQPSIRQRFEDEARSAARLTHPNVVIVLDSGEAEGCPYLVMECLPGHSLYDEIVRGPLADERVRAIALDVLAGLGAAHDIGIVHRDVKPGNILIADDGRAKLADFGIAKTTEGLDHTMVGQVLGTPAYLAPERLAGQSATPSADLYALGVVLYEALTGEQPFKGDTPIAVAHAVSATDAVALTERLPGGDVGFYSAIDIAMAKDPAKRFPSAAAMAAALDGGGAPTEVLDALGPSEASAEEPTSLLVITPPPATVVADSGVASRERFSFGQWWRGRPRELRLLVLGAIGLAILLLVLNAASGGNDTKTPVAPASSSPPVQSVPPSLDDALNRLEKAVRR